MFAKRRQIYHLASDVIAQLEEYNDVDPNGSGSIPLYNTVLLPTVCLLAYVFTFRGPQSE